AGLKTLKANRANESQKVGKESEALIDHESFLVSSLLERIILRSSLEPFGVAVTRAIVTGVMLLEC
ncbi:30394_t:CDS:2, partial [Racocetra persica]